MPFVGVSTSGEPLRFGIKWELEGARRSPVFRPSSNQRFWIFGSLDLWIFGSFDQNMKNGTFARIGRSRPHR